MATRDYLESLLAEISAVFPQREGIRVTTDIEDIVLPPKLLSPLGIIINECYTNTMKYAFAGLERDDCAITVSLAREAGRCRLVYADNGQGMPDTVSLENSTGFGLQLISQLVTQISGTVTLDRSAWVRYTIEFCP